MSDDPHRKGGNVVGDHTAALRSRSAVVPHDCDVRLAINVLGRRFSSCECRLRHADIVIDIHDKLRCVLCSRTDLKSNTKKQRKDDLSHGLFLLPTGRTFACANAYLKPTRVTGRKYVGNELSGRTSNSCGDG